VRIRLEMERTKGFGSRNDLGKLAEIFRGAFEVGEVFGTTEKESF